MRKFRIFNKSSSRVVVGSGAGHAENNRYPYLEHVISPTQVCHNLIEMDDLDYKIEGYYTFRFMKENEKPNSDPENIDDVDKSLLFRIYFGPFRLGLPEGMEFIKNPGFQEHMNYDC
jgi:hypothetical protein